MSSRSRHSPPTRPKRPHGGQTVPATPSPTRTLKTPQSKPQRRRKPADFLLLGMALFVAVVGGLLIYRSVVRATTGEGVAVLTSNHVGADAQPVYNSNPPTSGDHITSEAPWGISSKPLPDIALVHNLEHGGIVLHYRPDLDEAKRQQLEAVARELLQRNRKVVLAPRPENEDSITATAWGRILRLQTVDADAIRGFFSAHINQGPERVP